MTIYHHNLLLVGDRSRVWKEFERICEQAGYTVTRTDSTLEALAILDEESFGICLVDPEMFGVDDLLIQTQRNRDKGVLIGITADLTTQTVLRLLELGMWDCLRRDIPHNLLLLRIERAILERQGQIKQKSFSSAGPVQFTLLGLPSATRYCRTCYTVVEDRTLFCGNCQSERPKEGWARILESRFPWLGFPMDGRFVIEQVIGRGGAGVVYRAVDNQLRRQLAVKIVVISPELNAEKRNQSIRQLKAEALATAKVSSPHVVEIWDVIGLDESTTALVMDYIEGVTLSRYVREEGKLSVERSLKIARQVALALAAAHDQRLVHRDIKPQNIMIELLPDRSPFARVLDFGIVHAIDQLSEKKLSNVGTPMFAAPEQIKSLPIDERTDIYALGGVIHLMLTGSPPFPGKDARKLCRAHLKSPIPKLGIDVTTSTPLLRLLNQIISHCLAKKQNNRFSNIHKLIQAIDAALASSALNSCAQNISLPEQNSTASQLSTSDAEVDKILAQYLTRKKRN